VGGTVGVVVNGFLCVRGLAAAIACAILAGPPLGVASTCAGLGEPSGLVWPPAVRLPVPRGTLTGDVRSVGGVGGLALETTSWVKLPA
jgi:hypothetical protein